MTLDPLSIAIILWLVTASGYSTQNVVLRNSNIPRPGKPYIDILYSSVNKLGNVYKARPDGNGDRLILGSKEMVVSINTYSTDPIEPVSKLSDIEDSLDTENGYQILSSAGLAYVDTLMNPTDVSMKLDETIENRATMDLLFRFGYSVSETISFIERVVFNATYKNHAQEIIVNNTIDVNTQVS